MAEINRKRQIDRSFDKYNFWGQLRSIQSEHKAAKSNLEFTAWLTERYGIQIEEFNGMWGSAYTIVDEAKHTFYKLKYG